MSHWRYGSDMDHRSWLDGDDLRRPEPSRPTISRKVPAPLAVSDRDLGDEDDGWVRRQLQIVRDITASLDRESDRELRALRAEGYLR